MSRPRGNCGVAVVHFDLWAPLRRADTALHRAPIALQESAMVQPQPRTFLQRLLGTMPAAASPVADEPPQADPADLGTAYGLDLSFAQQAFATPLPPADTPAPPRTR